MAGQRLIGARMAAAVRCAPPANKPMPGERDRCVPWLTAELRMVAPSLRVIVCLGGFAWNALWPVLADRGYRVPRPRPLFGHGAEITVGRLGADGANSPGGDGHDAGLLILGLLPPKPAEHVHRPRHPGHGRRDLYPRSRRGRSSHGPLDIEFA